MGELLCGHQVTGCHGPHSWQSGFEKLLREGPVFVSAPGHLNRKWLLFHHKAPVYQTEGLRSYIMFSFLNIQTKKKKFIICTVSDALANKEECTNNKQPP